MDGELNWEWRIFYNSIEDDVVFADLAGYLDWLSSWYERKVPDGDLSLATKQLGDPPYLQGVSTWSESEDENQEEDDSEDEDENGD